jgi:hypothetical protein
LGHDKFKPKAKHQPHDRSFQPSVQQDPARRDRDLRPAWSLAYVDHDGPFGWSGCQSRDDLKEVAERLRNFESMKWQQLREGGSHVVEVAQCSAEAQKRLQELRRDDIDALYSLRISGKKRVIAVKLDHLLALLWWDPEHQVCPSEKKRT